jgi:hypothetical protein
MPQLRGCCQERSFFQAFSIALETFPGFLQEVEYDSV